jgi:hypothetical protein
MSCGLGWEKSETRIGSQHPRPGSRFVSHRVVDAAASDCFIARSSRTRAGARYARPTELINWSSRLMWRCCAGIN